ncbi:LysR family transcriptional regulator [Salmonella enterica]|nr:LysR family transcriptional regulator [Salmonella enterica]
MEHTHLQLNHMATFLVVARSMSFTVASEELYLTQGAISHRINSLETALGFKLFVRMTRKLELTNEGQRLQATLSSVFKTINEEIESIHNNELSGELYVGVAPTFALSWLVPRLPDFQKKYPHLDIRLRVKASKLDFKHEPVDLAIYYGTGQNAGFYQKRLYDEYLTPVMCPVYANELSIYGCEDIQRLSEARLVHCIEGIDTISPRYEWEFWLKQTGVEIPFKRQQTIINHAEMAISAARHGMGVAMGRVSLARPYLNEKILIAPFQFINSGFGYDVICPAGLENRPRYKAFMEWLVLEAERERSLIDI